MSIAGWLSAERIVTAINESARTADVRARRSGNGAVGGIGFGNRPEGAGTWLM
jgi:hypothetical protein